MDYVNSLGGITLDHRFKRLMNRLIAEAAAVYEDCAVPFRPRWMSTMRLLHDDGPQGVTDLAQRLKLTHPALIQITGGMAEAGLIRAAKDSRDARRRVFHLTAKGRKVFPRMVEIWDDLGKAQLDAFRAAGWDVLELLAAAEAELDRKSISQRFQELRQRRDRQRSRRRTTFS